MNDQRIEKARHHYYVCKSNDLVREARYSLSLLSQRLISYICMLIKPGEYDSYSDYQMKYEFEIEDFYHTMGLKRISSTAYANARNALKSLLTDQLWLPGKNQPITWLSFCDITGDNHVTIVLHSGLGGDLLDLTDHYIRYNLADISDINSTYGLRLYEYFLSYLYLHTVTVKLETLRNLLMIDDQSAYQQYSAFKQRVLAKAIEEINQNSNIKVKYFEIKKRHKVQQLQFHITSEYPSAESIKDDLPF